MSGIQENGAAHSLRQAGARRASMPHGAGAHGKDRPATSFGAIIRAAVILSKSARKRPTSQGSNFLPAWPVRKALTSPIGQGFL